MIRKSSYINLCLCFSAFKLLLLKSYVSTDFDVHRNWMAITHNLPPDKWYFDETSEWTLDYPPLFAAFEWLLALIAYMLNINGALTLTKSSIRTEEIIVYQKLTVVFGDLIYYYAVYRLCLSLERILNTKLSRGRYKIEAESLKEEVKKDRRNETKPEQNLIKSIHSPDSGSAMALLLLFQPGLLLVDHIHFQYNGLLSGMLLLSISAIVEHRHVEGSFWFASLLCWKHIYLYCAPAFGVYLLAGFCLSKDRNQPLIISFIKRVTKLGLVVTSVLIVTFLPFLDSGQLKQIASRLFPFKRGLTHAYWAPNIWSLYNSLDKILATALKVERPPAFDMDSISGIKPASSTSGLVQEYQHLYLPSVTPAITFTLVAIFTLPLTAKFLQRPGKPLPFLFLRGVAVSSLTAFMFGWHVHEKAIIVSLIPFIPISFVNRNLRRAYLRLTFAGTYSLFPLLFQQAELLTKTMILIAYHSFAYYSYRNRNQPRVARDRASWYYNVRNLIDRFFILGLIIVQLYSTFIHGRFELLGRMNKLDFLPLMLTSSISALGITLSYLELYYDFVFCDEEDDVGTTEAAA